MRPHRYEITSAESPKVIAVDWASSEDLAIQAVPTTTETYTVEITVDRVLDPLAPAPHWVGVEGMIGATTAQIKSVKDGVAGVRVTLDAGTQVDVTLAQPIG
jgi:hypothetical protein